jgi:hypothetical protein
MGLSAGKYDELYSSEKAKNIVEIPSPSAKL